MKKLILLAATLTVVSWPLTASAHKRWMLPSDFTLSEAEQVSVDFSASNSVFYMDKAPSPTGIRIIDPAGKTHAPINPVQRKRRSVFDVNIDKKGSYRIIQGGSPVYFATYKIPGKQRPQWLRANTLSKLNAQIPAAAEDTHISESVSRITTYITLGSTSDNFSHTGKGIELAGGTHPNSLYSDEQARFAFMLNGKPARGLTLKVTPDGARYRDTLATKQYTLNTKGEAHVNWPTPGRYLLEVASREQAPKDSDINDRRYHYFLTVEVLKP